MTMTMTDECSFDIATAFEQLAKRFGDDFITAQTVRDQHAGLEGHHLGKVPDAVLMARSLDDVVDAVRLFSEHRVPIIAHGAGTSLEGHLSAVHGGVALDLTALDRVIEIDPDNLRCRVGAGVTREQLNLELRNCGLFFPIDPGANATIGGMASTRASGTNAVRYGTMRENVLSLQVVLADGRVIETGTKAAKSSAGYDLTGLFVGSEGTLGIITAVTLKLYGIPETILAGTCRFDDLNGAVRSVITAIQLGIPLARIELLDAMQVSASNAYSNLDLPVMPTLFLEFHGSSDAVAEQSNLFAQIADDNGGSALEIAYATEDRSRLWKARHNAYFAAKALRPNASVWSTDVCVPIAALADSILQTREDIDQTGLTATIVGHVGDGNYHVLFVLDPNRPQDRVTAAEVNDRMVERALAAGGTCTGEHGIGVGKQECLIAERGADAVGVMLGIKTSLDPAAILNPGKIFADSVLSR